MVARPLVNYSRSYQSIAPFCFIKRKKPYRNAYYGVIDTYEDVKGNKKMTRAPRALCMNGNDHLTSMNKLYFTFILRGFVPLRECENRF